ncbi:DUF6397 family protein [Streptomyces profundus]|uniref:DUF6397 family protein n=1 Tax=Streptomyces profundus TaxID=2867410 RepID=UPI001D16AF35|nr:DUF6397 family protein [Streptomyces sp. MA3_2.13]UED88108.1 DUF6397 family protein [Streptomyces sp. MA3_2.13]
MSARFTRSSPAVPLTHLTSPGYAPMRSPHPVGPPALLAAGSPLLDRPPLGAPAEANPPRPAPRRPARGSLRRPRRRGRPQGRAERADHGPERVRYAPRRLSGKRFPERPVSASAGAVLMGISTARFSRLARGGCFSPSEFHLTEHGVVAWRFPPDELCVFARRRPGLLTGPLPDGLRHSLRQGQDWRPRRWRARRTGLLAGQASCPWEAAAVPAAVLDPGTLEAEVPDPVERAVLGRLRPPLMAARLAAGPWRSVRRLLTARDPDEVGWYREQLGLALDAARGRPLPLAAPLTAGPRQSP